VSAWTAVDVAAMGRALQLARQGLRSTHPNPRVGCVLLRDGEAVGEGAHLRAGEPHAEVHALWDVASRAAGATAYVTLEPCNHHGRTPPCVDALIAAGVARVVMAVEDPNPQVAGQGAARLAAAGIAVDRGLMAEEARRLNRGFFSRMQRGRPWLTLKLAASLDGRTATAGGESQWITGAAARADVHRLRAEAGAVLVGADTVLADNPRLSVRDSAPAPRPPDRIVLDSRARVPSTAAVWADDGARRYWLTAADGPAPPGVLRYRLPTREDGRLDLSAVLGALAGEGVNDLLVEAGAQLSGAWLAAGLVDELLVYLAPRLLGDDGRGLARLPGLNALADAPAFRFSDVRAIGDDLRLTLHPSS
jgi:diaminohydroxyphosphoribosylaminopyrimidine deaminase / 5-amino-6-(5-phosphoribosylamino)uracil reductase